MLRVLFFLTLKSLWLMTVTWIELFRAVVNFHTNMCWRFISWTVSVTTLPFRALAALQREKTMDRLLQEMQSELENLSLDNEKLQARLQMAVKERHLMESMLAEIEEENDKVISKIEVLEREVQHLKDENLRLKESTTKGLLDPTRKSDVGGKPISGTKSSKSRTRDSPGDMMMHKSSYAAEKRASAEVNPTGLVDPLTPLVFSTNIDTDAALYQRKEVALFQSLFSAVLSLLVGAIIWEAKDPCMPLVLALFSVVGLSLRSVLQFFSTIRNRPASDAVALLSINWFILGALTYPSLPRVTRMLSPIVVAFSEPVFRRLGL